MLWRGHIRDPGHPQEPHHLRHLRAGGLAAKAVPTPHLQQLPTFSLNWCARRAAACCSCPDALDAHPPPAALQGYETGATPSPSPSPSPATPLPTTEGAVT